MRERLSLQTNANGISVNGKPYQGSRLGYEFVARNPLNPEKLIVVIGMDQWDEAKRWRLHPSRDGICDYFIFDLSEQLPRIRDAGYFDDSVWQTHGGVPTPDGAAPN